MTCIWKKNNQLANLLQNNTVVIKDKLLEAEPVCEFSYSQIYVHVKADAPLKWILRFFNVNQKTAGQLSEL